MNNINIVADQILAKATLLSGEKEVVGYPIIRSDNSVLIFEPHTANTYIVKANTLRRSSGIRDKHDILIFEGDEIEIIFDLNGSLCTFRAVVQTMDNIPFCIAVAEENISLTLPSIKTTYKDRVESLIPLGAVKALSNYSITKKSKE